MESPGILAPEWWPIMLVGPALMILMQRADALRQTQLLDRVGVRSHVLVEGLNPTRRRQRRFIAALGVTLMSAAILQPVWGDRPSSVAPKGLDILVVLDVSKSMWATDIAPSRLEWARRAIRDFSTATQGDRMGVVAFAGEARVLTPLTQDMTAIATLAEEVDSTFVSRGGTDIGGALETALSLLKSTDGEAACVVLLTDGEDIAGSASRAIERAKERAVPIHVVPIGLSGGAKIPTPRGFLTDRNGNDVISVPDAAGLTSLANATGGKVADVRRDGALRALYREVLAPDAKRAFEVRGEKERRQAYAIPLLLGLVLLAWELGRTDRDPRRVGGVG